MRFVSTFSGIEAASVAWNQLGWECRCVAEVDPFACAVLEHRFPLVENVGDVRDVDWSRFKGTDLLVGGSPCTGFSVAGKREGLLGGIMSKKANVLASASLVTVLGLGLPVTAIADTTDSDIAAALILKRAVR